MDLVKKYLADKTEFSSYEDFLNNCKLKLPKHFNFAQDVVDVYAAECPQKLALVWCDDDGHEEQFTFGQLSQRSKELALKLMELGIKKGDSVMLVLHRHYEYWFFVLALHRIGAVAVPVPSQLLTKDFEYRIKACDAKMIVASPWSTDELFPLIEKAVEQSNTKPLLISIDYKKDSWIDLKTLFSKKSEGSCQSKDFDFESGFEEYPLIMYFTSGTTDEPKLVVHNNFYPLGHIITAKYWQQVIPDGLHYSVAETGWGKASWGKIYGQWIAGSAVFVYDRHSFNPESILEKIQKYKITSFCAPPTIYRYLVHTDLKKYDLSALKHCTSAGEPLNPDVYESFFQKTGLKICEGYGQTETCLITGVFNQFDKDSPVGSMGRASPFYNVKILNRHSKECRPNKIGEIVIEVGQNSPVGLMSGYFNAHQIQPVKDSLSYYHTGDLAYKDKKGFIFFAGRKDNVIKSSGFRISPFEVERLLQPHPAVLECAVTGEKDKNRGQIVKAVVVLAKGYSPSRQLEQELMAYVRNQTALYKCPRKIEFVKKLPKTYNDKIKRFIVRNGK